MGIGSNDNIDKRLVEKYQDSLTVSCDKCNNPIPNFIKPEFIEENFEYSNIYDEDILTKFKDLPETLKQLIKHPKINKKKLVNLRQEMRDMFNPNKLYERLGIDVVNVVVGTSLIPIADPDKKGSLLPNIALLRKYLTDKYGFILPIIRVLDSTNLAPNHYQILIREKCVFEGSLDEKCLFENDSMPIINSIQNMCIKYANQVLTKTDALKLMELVRSQDPTLVNDLIPTFISALDLKRILTNLITERISIKDIILVFEILNDYARFTQDTNELTQIVKRELEFV